MNSQNNYHLSFNPRGPPTRHNRAERPYRYVPQIKNNPNFISWKPPLEQLSHDMESKMNELVHSPSQKEFKIDLNQNESGYMSNVSISISKREEEARKERERSKKEEMVRRVKQLQEKVLPMVGRGHQEEGDELQAGWQSRIDLKLMRIETSLDNYRREWEVLMERKIIELDNQMQQKFNELVSQVNH